MCLANIGPRSNPAGSNKKSFGSGKETLRLRANGPARVEEAVSRSLLRKSLYQNDAVFRVLIEPVLLFQKMCGECNILLA